MMTQLMSPPVHEEPATSPPTSRLAARMRLVAIGVVGMALSFGVLTWLGVGTPPADAPPPPVADPVETPDAAADLAAAAAYLDEFKPLAEDAGFVVENGLKLGITDIGQRRYDDETLREMPVTWGRMLAETREDVAALTPPDALVEAHDRFLEAIDSYREVATLLTEAARLPGDRDEAVARAAAQGELSDQIWNDGAVIVQDHLRSLGAETVYWLPDPELDGRHEP